MKKVILLLMIFCFAGIGLSAQDGGNPRMSPEDFRAKQEAFLTEKAQLTKDEAAKFFPMYFELQDKKKALNDRAWSEVKKGKKGNLSESQYEEIVINVLNARIASDKLEKAYLTKYKTILSYGKIFKIQGAEMRFHRELLKEIGRKPK